MKPNILLAIMILCPLFMFGQADYYVATMPQESADRVGRSPGVLEVEDLGTNYWVIARHLKNPKSFTQFQRRMQRKGVPVFLRDSGSQGSFAYYSKHTTQHEAMQALDALRSSGYNARVAYLDQTNNTLAPIGNFGGLPGANSSTSIGRSKTLRQADRAYNNLWYAKASKLYEKAIEKNPSTADPILLERAAEANYLNTDLDRAHQWYQMLFASGKEEMSAEGLFRYAQTLKAKGQYEEAKKVLAAYWARSGSGGPGETMLTDPEGLVENPMNLASTEVINLPSNSSNSEFAPVFYQDGELVLAASNVSKKKSSKRYRWNDQPFLDLYAYSWDDEKRDLVNPRKLPKTINSKYHEAAVSFSPDKKTMYFTRNNYNGKLHHDNRRISHLKIYKTEFMDNSWSKAEEVPFNDDRYSVGHPAVSPDGTKLYFVSDMPGTLGQTDIYVVDILENGTYSEPRNLGAGVNTEKREMFPWIIEDHIYFASDGHPGLGGLDIYEATFDEGGEVSETRNLGAPYNSSWDDFSYTRDREKAQGFFASNRPGGKGSDDIYAFFDAEPTLNENAIAGIIADLDTEQVLAGTRVAILDQDGNTIAETTTSEEGRFVFGELDSHTPYRLVYEKTDYQHGEEEVSTADNRLVEVFPRMRKLDNRIVEEDGVSKLKTEAIYFDFDKHSIREDASLELDKIVEVMNAYPTMVIAIESHTDSRGKRAYNKWLSEKRANATRDYLISQGISPDRIDSAIGYGEERLLNDCDGTAPCPRDKHQQNRRSEFIILQR